MNVIKDGELEIAGLLLSNEANSNPMNNDGLPDRNFLLKESIENTEIIKAIFLNRWNKSSF